MKHLLQGPLLATALSLWLATYAWAGFEEGVAAYKRGDYATAYEEFLPIAEQGDARAQVVLGVMYDKGEGVPQDYAEAVRWFRLAAEQGGASAQFYLGWKYENGEGVAQDYAKATKWYSLATKQGFDRAQVNLGLMYFNGEGGAQDYIQAHMWSNLAAAQGDNNGRKNRDIIAEKMTAADISKAQVLAREWLEKQGE